VISRWKIRNYWLSKLMISSQPHSFFSPPKDVLVSDSAVSALQRISPTNRGFTTKQGLIGGFKPLEDLKNMNEIGLQNDAK